MERVNKILHSEKYKIYLQKNKYLEEDRIFCKHNLEHFLDTARIAYIMCLEQGIKINKEVVYGLGLLHDIGRFMEYEEGIPHDEASAELAKEILDEAGYNKEEKNLIKNCILSHRKNEQINIHKDMELKEIFYKADKLSRNCYNCEAKPQCKWDDSKKNFNIKF